ncbi:uncharacterized protein LOC132282850 isoform X3 [Cornus florida]|uniref:uncharacterized protein LOC132282850 isoform X3 n=1 Tax=Cornus florida TaxID=4283 RepID=UPI002897130E|nr:uncharacterized protein LOC132282850 isoform X3 [Cornus florida]
MSTIFRARQSGGKMVRDRRMAAPKSPYDRPTPPQNHPHWFTGLVFPATRMIATGAGKLLSSVLLDTSSSSDRDSGSEDDIDNDSDDNDMIDIPPLEVEELIKNGTSSRTAKRFRKEPHLTVEKSETKRAIEIIEPLLLQETFSREESDRLIKIINSRAVDCSNIKVGQDGRLSEIPSRTVANDIPGLCNKAVMEAKKWLEEKKEGSSSKSDLDYGTCTFNLVEQPHVTEGEVGSPADVAKSYMRARPLWESPSVSFFDIKTPLQVGIELFKEETPYSVGGNSLSTSKQKRDSLATGSWNILEEIRRVRSKATEDMLRNLPSAKIDLSSFASEPKRTQISLVADVKEAAVGNKLHHSNCLATAEAIDASADLATDHVFPVLEMREDGSRNEAFSSNPATFVSEKTQDLDVIHIIGGAEDAASRSSHSIALDFASKQHTASADSRSSERNCSMAKHVTELGGTPKASSSQSSGPSFSAGLGSERNPRSFDGNSMPVNSSHNKLNSSIPIEGTCELLSEASIEVPVVNEINNVASGYRNSSSLRYEELSLQLRQQNLKRSMTGKIGSMVEKQLREKKSRYIKRGQGSPL